MLKSFKNNNIVSMRKREGKSEAWRVLGDPSYSYPSSLGTTPFKKEVRGFSSGVKRKVIFDKDISPAMFEKIKTKCTNGIAHRPLTQKDIIEFLYPLKLSNVTIAKVVNDLVEGANATQGSIASMIRFLKQSKKSVDMAKELEKLLEEDL